MKTVTKTIIEVNYNDLDEAITKFLKSKGFSDKNFDQCGYESAVENEWSNDQSHSFAVDGKIYSYQQEQVDRKKWGKLSTRTLLNLMFNEGLIESGEYIVDVSW